MWMDGWMDGICVCKRLIDCCHSVCSCMCDVKVVLLGRYNAQGLDNDYELLIRVVEGTKSTYVPEVAQHICCWSIFYFHFSRYRDFKILQIWLKTPVEAPKIYVLGVLTPKCFKKTLKMHFRSWRHSFWALIGRSRTCGATGMLNAGIYF